MTGKLSQYIEGGEEKQAIYPQALRFLLQLDAIRSLHTCKRRQQVFLSFFLGWLGETQAIVSQSGSRQHKATSSSVRQAS